MCGLARPDRLCGLKFPTRDTSSLRVTSPGIISGSTRSGLGGKVAFGRIILSVMRRGPVCVILAGSEATRFPWPEPGGLRGCGRNP